MAIIRLKVTYADLREEYVIASPRARVMAEDYIGDSENRANAGTYYLAWASLNKSGREPLDYETWLDRIIDVDEAEEPPKPEPTPPAPSGDDLSG